jgi:hypothetical protein
VRLRAREAQHLRLLRSHQEIDDLHLFRLAFAVLLNIGAGGEDLNVLEERPHLWAFRNVDGSRRIAGDEHIDTHAGSHETGDTNHLVDFDRASAHALADGCGKSAA